MATKKVKKEEQEENKENENPTKGTKKWIYECPVCHEVVSTKSFTCLHCLPEPQWVHNKCGGYKYSDVRKAEPASLRCNNCKEVSFFCLHDSKSYSVLYTVNQNFITQVGKVAADPYFISLITEIHPAQSIWEMLYIQHLALLDR